LGVVRASLGKGAAGTPSIRADLSDSLESVSDTILERLAHLFDVAADSVAIDSHLADNGLRASIGRTAGVRVPGAFDAFELAIRAVLGQQVTVKGASTLMSRLTHAFGEPIETNDPGLTHLAVTADRLANASVSDIREIGLPNARAATIHALATCVANGAISLESQSDAPELRSKLLELPGCGPWTVDYIAMRVAHWTDAFPASDVALRTAMGNASPAKLALLAEPWRPFRAYAAMRLWLHGPVG
jgi:AraC family transcriptional regulator of adaptative response / DNA-3-methyladenine glycosylase II